MPHPIKLPLRAAALVAAILSLPAFAAGLGELSLRSHLGQPLRAEIDLVALDPAEREQLQARLATVEAHQRANVEFAPALQSLRVTLGQRAGGQPFVRIVSHAPINEPFLRFLIELGTQSGRITREYTVLLDPPGAVKAGGGIAVELPAASATVEAGGNQPGSTPRRDRRASPAHSEAARTDAAGSHGFYVVQPGDSLSQIALEQRHEGVSLQRMMTALHRANEGAFIDGNADRLVAGRTLRIPTIDAVRALEPGDGAERARADSGARSALQAQTAPSAPRQLPSADDSRSAPDTEIRSSRLERLEPPAKSPARPRDRLTLAAPPAAAPDPAGEAAERLVQRQRARVFELENRMDELLNTLKQANERIGQLNRELDTIAARRSATAGADASSRPADSKPAPGTSTVNRTTEVAAQGADATDRGVKTGERSEVRPADRPPVIGAPAVVPPALVLPGAASAEADPALGNLTDPALRTFADRARGRLVPIVGSLVVLLGVLLLALRWWLRARVDAADEGPVYSGAAVEEMLAEPKEEDHWQPLSPDSADAMVTTEVDLNIGELAGKPGANDQPAKSALDDAIESVLHDEREETARVSPLASWSARLLTARRGAASSRQRGSR